MTRIAHPPARLRPATLRSALLAAGMLVLAAASSVSAAGPAAISPSAATVHTREITVAQNETGKGSVTCPAGKVAISGGAVFHRPDEAPAATLSAKLIASGPTLDGRGWHGAGAAFEATPVELRVTVVCRPASAVGPYTVRTRDVALGLGVQASGSLDCGSGKRFVTGGVLWNPGAGGPDGADNLLVSSPSADGTRWRATGFSYGEGRFLRIVLLCRPTSSMGAITVKHRDITTDSLDAGGSVACGTGRRATAGGVDWYANGSPSAVVGSLIGSSVRLDRKGWYAAASMAPGAVAMRITVVCVPA